LVQVQTTSWYKKKHVTFSDVLAYVRGKILREKYFIGFDKNPDLGIKEIEEFIYHMVAA
jgi:predicted nucleic-acid-binding protein